VFAPTQPTHAHAPVVFALAQALVLSQEQHFIFFQLKILFLIGQLKKK
jgi:hypothetical protein